MVELAEARMAQGAHSTLHRVSTIIFPVSLNPHFMPLSIYKDHPEGQNAPPCGSNAVAGCFGGARRGFDIICILVPKPSTQYRNPAYLHIITAPSSIQLTSIRFGTVATLLELVPVASILFSFTNTGKRLPRASVISRH